MNSSKFFILSLALGGLLAGGAKAQSGTIPSRSGSPMWGDWGDTPLPNLSVMIDGRNYICQACAPGNCQDTGISVVMQSRTYYCQGCRGGQAGCGTQGSWGAPSPQ